MHKVKISNILIDNVSTNECLAYSKSVITNNDKVYIVTPNVDHIVKLKKDKDFLKIYQNAGLVLADGMPLILASKLFRTPLKEKISGSDLFPKMCEDASREGFRIFLLGGLEGVAEKAANKLREDYCDINICGTYCPPFGFEKDERENNKIIKMINDSGAQLLFVGVGAPKQEKWIYDNIDKLNINLAIGIGASFDFIAGTIKRAPKLMQNLSLEWFYRFLQEPKRLFRRYFIEDSAFLFIVFRQLLGIGKGTMLLQDYENFSIRENSYEFYEQRRA